MCRHQPAGAGEICKIGVLVREVKVVKIVAALLTAGLLAASGCVDDSEVGQPLLTQLVDGAGWPTLVSPTESSLATAISTPQVGLEIEAAPEISEEVFEETKVSGGDFADPLTEELHFALAEELQTLAEMASSWNPDVRVSITVELSDGFRHGLSPQESHNSASATKSLWAAAALDVVGLEAAQSLSYAALVDSHNLAAGQLIDLAGGVDAVNEWGRNVARLQETYLEAWRFGADDRVASDFNPDKPLGNRTSTSDLAKFYARFYRGQLLDASLTAALQQWLRDTPRSMATSTELGGVLLDRLPREVAAASLHKGGWLPPGCCSIELRHMLDAGVIVLPDGEWFSVAVLSTRGEYFDQTVRWVSLAACRLYVIIAKDLTASCDRPGDGVHDPAIWLLKPDVLIESPTQSASEPAPVLYFTFDDGPDPIYTPQILDVLKRYGVQATFFVVGSVAASQPNLLQRIMDEGHAVANHTWNHDDLTKLTRAEFDETVGRTETLLGTDGANCLRPPYALFNETTRLWALEHGLEVVTWDFSPKDWEPQSPEKIARKIVANAYNNAILLLHDGGGNRSSTVLGLELALEELSQKGFQYNTLDCA